MRYDKDYVIFAGHFDWFKVVSGVGYVPTEKAPKEAREAERLIVVVVLPTPPF